jgi:hypothetical protein
MLRASGSLGNASGALALDCEGQNTSLFHPSSGHFVLPVSLKTSDLGMFATLCVMQNGTGVLGDTQYPVYLSPVREVNVTAVIGDRLYFTCVSGACANPLVAFGFDCGGVWGDSKLPTEPVAGKPDLFTAPVPNYAPGTWPLCIQARPGLPMSYAAFDVFFSPVFIGAAAVPGEAALIETSYSALSGGWAPESCEVEFFPVAIRATGAEWIIPLSAKTLPGLTYQLCLEGLDGTVGNAGFVYVTPFVVKGLPTVAGLNDTLDLDCFVDCTNVTASLGCDRFRPLNVTVDANNTAKGVTFTSGLSEGWGRYFRVCSDLDGRGPIPSGYTGIEVYGSAVIAAPITFSIGEHVSLSVRCEGGCTQRSVAFITTPKTQMTTCVNATMLPGLFQQERILNAHGRKEPQVGAWRVVLDTRSLKAGYFYALCTDLDGTNETLNFTTTSTTTTAMPTPEGNSSDPTTTAEPTLFSDVNATNATIEADEIFVTLPAGDTGFRIYATAIDKVGSASILYGSPQQIIVTCNTEGCSTDSVLFLADDCMAPKKRTAPAPFGKVGHAWRIVIDTTPLMPGVHYAVCTDLDGNGPMPTGPAGATLFVSPAMPPTGYPFAVFPIPNMEIRLSCEVAPEVCSTTSTAYLAPSCDLDPPDEVSNFEEVGGAVYRITVDASGLVPGAAARLCLRLFSGALPGDAGQVYVNPVSAVAPFVPLLQAGATQYAWIACATCTNKTRAVIVAACADAAGVNGSPLLPGSPKPDSAVTNDVFESGVANVELRTNASVPWYGFAMTEDSTARLGKFGYICIDIDGEDGPMPFGFASDVFLSPVLEVPTAASPTSTSVSFSCTSCSDPAAAVVMPGEDCSGVGAGELVTTTANGEYAVGVNVSYSALGGTAILCVDMDGLAGPMGFGPSLGVFASPVLRADPFLAPVNERENAGMMGNMRFNATCFDCLAAELTIGLTCANFTPSTRQDLTGSLGEAVVPGYGAFQDGDMYIVADALELGIDWQLCIKYTGSRGFRFAGYTMYASSLWGVRSVQTVSTRAELNVTCAVCTSSATLALTPTLDGSCRPELPRVGLNVLELPVRELSGRLVQGAIKVVQQAIVDPSGLSPGTYAGICVDADGPSGPMPERLSALRVFASPIQLANMSLYAPSPDIEVICPTCTNETRLAIASDDDDCWLAPYANVVHLGNSTRSTAWAATVDVTGLRRGDRYLLCVQPHIGGLVGPAGHEVYLHEIFLHTLYSRPMELLPLDLHVPLTSAPPEEDNALAASMVIVPEGTCTVGTVATLARQYGLGFISRLRNSTFVDGTFLKEGFWFEACVDIDGPDGPRGAGSIGLVYMSGITTFRPYAMGPRFPTKFDLMCIGCSPRTYVFFSTDCNTWSKSPSYLDAGEPNIGEMIQLMSDGSSATNIPTGFFYFDPYAHPILPGTWYTLCTYLDAGDPTVRPGPTHYLVYYSGIYAIETDRVYALAEQVVTVLCGGCQDGLSMILFYDVEADYYVTSGTLYQIEGEVWQATVDATGAVAKWYALRADLDGPGPMAIGDTSLDVAVTEVVTLHTVALHRNDDQMIHFTCLECGESRVFIAKDCIQFKPDVLPDAMSQWSSYWDAVDCDENHTCTATVDLPRSYVEFSFDAAGEVDVGYTQGITRVLTTGVYRRPNQTVEFRCDAGTASGCGPDGVGFLYIAPSACGPDGTFPCTCVDAPEYEEGSDVRTATVPFDGFLKAWSILVDATYLMPGYQYIFCADLDGFEYEDENGDLQGASYGLQAAGEGIYISGVVEIHSPRMQPTMVNIDLECYGCSNVTTGYVSRGACLDRDEERRQSEVLLEGSLGDWHFVLPNNLTGYPAGGWLAICADLDGFDGPLPAGGTNLYVYMEPGVLVGERYEICQEKGGDVVPTKNQLHIVALTDANPRTIAPVVNEELTLDCPVGCSTISVVFLAVDCNSTRDRTDAAPLYRKPGDGPTTWYASVDASVFSGPDTGRTYELCFDVDGEEGPFPPGLSFIPIYIAGVSETSLRILRRTTAERIMLVCAAQCSTVSTAYIGVYCDTLIYSGYVPGIPNVQTPSSNFEYIDGEWIVVLDTTYLTPGSYYRFCTDFDGPGEIIPFGDALLPFYVSGITELVEDVIYWKPSWDGTLSALRFLCPVGCNENTKVFLSEDCRNAELPGKRLTPEQELALLFDLEIVIDDTLPITSSAGSPVFDSVIASEHPLRPMARNGSWEVLLDIQELQPGRTYEICSVINAPFGFDSSEIGWTSLSVYLSPLTPMYEYGPILIERKRINDDPHEILVDIDTCFHADGVLIEIGMWVMRTQIKGHRFVLWRPVAERCVLEPCDFEVLEISDEVYMTYGAVRVYRLPTPWRVKKGDCLGWKTDILPVLPYDNQVQRAIRGRHNQVFVQTFDCPDPTLFGGRCVPMIGTTYTFRAKDTRSYAFQLRYVTDRIPELLTLPQRVGDLRYTVACPPPHCSFATYARLADNCSYWTWDQWNATGEVGTEAVRLYGNDRHTFRNVHIPERVSFEFLVDGSALVPGRNYELCIDLDGPEGPLEFGPAGSVAYMNSINLTEPGIKWNCENPSDCIDILDAEGMAVDMIAPFGGLTDQSVTYLGMECDGRGEAGPDRTAVTTAHGRGDKWGATYDASPLLATRYYQVCVDVDGDGPFPYGTANQSVFVTFTGMIASRTTSIRAAGTQPYQIECFSGCRAQQYINSPYATSIYLSRDACDVRIQDGRMEAEGIKTTENAYVAPLPGFEDADEQTKNTAWEATMFASALEVGTHYKVCIDLDGGDPFLAYMDSTFKVYVSPIDYLLYYEIYKAADQVLLLHCTRNDDDCHPESATGATAKTWAYLQWVNFTDLTRPDPCSTERDPEAIKAIPGNNTFAVPMQEETNALGQKLSMKLTFDCSELDPGSWYTICTDTDFANPKTSGDSATFVYISGVLSIYPYAVLPETEFPIDVHLPWKAMERAVSYIAKVCDTTITDGASVPGIPGVQTAAVLINGTADWKVSKISVDQLTVGEFYDFCTDLDGPGPKTVSRIPVTMYVSPVKKLLTSKTILRDYDQIIDFYCPYGCTDRTIAYLSTECDMEYSGLRGGAPGEWTRTERIKSFHTLGISEEADGNFRFEVQAKSLVHGMHYRLCIDLDGSEGPKTFGDTQFLYHVTDVFAMDPVAVGAEPQVGLSFSSCSTGCGTYSTAFFTLFDCDAPTLSDKIPDPSPTRFNKEHTYLEGKVVTTKSYYFEVIPATKRWGLMVDAITLTTGAIYKLCIDPDGQGELRPGTQEYLVNRDLPSSDTGLELYVTPARGQVTTTVVYSEGEQVLIDCPGCSASSKGYLGRNCAAPRTPATATEPSMLESAANDYRCEEGLVCWKLTTTTLDLAPNLVYRLCLDIDGDESDLFIFGDTGILIYLSAILGIQRPALNALVNMTLGIYCDSCSPEMSGYLTRVGGPFRESLQRYGFGCGAQLLREATGDHLSYQVRSPPLQVDDGGEGKYILPQDARGLIPGEYYFLCIDPDGPDGPEGPGDAGAFVYVSGVGELFNHSLNREPTQTVVFDCPETDPRPMAIPNGEVKPPTCTGVSTGFFVPRERPSLCTDPNATRTFGETQFVSWDGLVGAFVFDGSLLPFASLGGLVELCTDIDGPGPLPVGGTGLELYVVVQLESVTGLQSLSTYGSVTVQVVTEAETNVTCAASWQGVVQDIFMTEASSQTEWTVGNSVNITIGNLRGSREYWVTCAPYGFVWRGEQRQPPVRLATLLVEVQLARAREDVAYHNAVAFNIDVLAQVTIYCVSVEVGTPKPTLVEVLTNEGAAISECFMSGCPITVVGLKASTAYETWCAPKLAFADEHVQPGGVVITQTAMTAGGDGTHCGVLAQLSFVRCWGPTEERFRATPALRAKFLSGHNGHMCAVTLPDHGIACWSTMMAYEDVVVENAPTSTGWSAVAVGGSHACALNTLGTAMSCWGLNTFGQATAQERGADVGAGLFLRIVAGEMHSCALQGNPGVAKSHDIVCWGYDLDGRATPPADLKLIEICAGETFTCGLEPIAFVNGSVLPGVDPRLAKPVCWGGDLHEIVSTTPVDAEFIAISCGLHHACGIRHSDNAPQCWGRNHRGQAAAPDLPVIEVALGTYHSCATQLNGTALCWGDVEDASRDDFYLPDFSYFSR